MLALLHALERPPGLLSVVAADSPASIPAFVAGCNELLDAMEPEVRDTIRAGERSGETATPEFQAAVMQFYRRHVCRLETWPEDVVRELRRDGGRSNGLRDHERPHGVHRRGHDPDFDITDRLPEIEVPVLLVSGAHDEVRPHVVAAMQERLRHGEWVLFEDSSHMPHIEEPERFLEVVEEFLERSEA